MSNNDDEIDYENLDLSFDDCLPSDVEESGDVNNIIQPPPATASTDTAGSFLFDNDGVASAASAAAAATGNDGAHGSTTAALAAAASSSSSSSTAAWDDDDEEDDLGKSKLKKKHSNGSEDNKNNKNFGDDDDYFGGDDDDDEQYILGTLVVRVVAARNLDPVESSGIASKLFGGGGGGGRGGISYGGSGGGGGTSNPYASVRFGTATQRTSQVFGTVDPMWPRGEAMFMDVTHPNLASSKTATTTDEDELDASEHSNRSSASSHSSSSNPGDPPTKGMDMTKKGSGEPNNGGDNEGYDANAFQEPVLTVAIFHASSNDANSMYPVKKKGGGGYSGDSDDVFLGMASTSLTELLTGKTRSFDDWIPLSGCGGSSSRRGNNPPDSPRRVLHRSNSDNIPSVRIVCEYEASDPPPRAGDDVRFTKFCHPSDLYPAHPNQVFTVEEDCNRTNDLVLISQTSPAEGWVTTFQVHRYMLFTIKRHQDAMDMYQAELVSISQKLANSPLVDVVQESISTLPEQGLVTVGLSALQGGASLLTRWLEGGVGTAVDDIKYATNIDGRFNPDAASQLSTATADENDEDNANNNNNNNNQGAQRDAPSATGNNFTAVPDLSSAAPAVLEHHHELLPNMPACPITQEPMRDPVVAADGHTYERSAILRWFQTSDKSPLTGQVLPHKELVANYMLLSSLRETASSSGSKEAPAAAAAASATASTVKLAPTVSGSGIVVETVTESDADTDIDGEDLDEHTTEEINID